ncbi:MAG: SDR family NAD(P)-dependent oxidoreductase [Proteobacteria bacterium]|nr:SDR family NAD(P)-dependent oxidoreductase [Pseudomonadota bacterium]HQR03142.1 SDR family NAD(P)-dependent oxidoreductase [Rhodocyclaceae bacterium]
MTTPIQYQGNTAVITGAASGIGTGLARQAAKLGMRLVLADVNADALHAFAATLDAETLAVPTDVTQPESVQALADKAWDRFGGVTLLFNNAGLMATGFSWEITPERYDRCMGVNFGGVLNGIRSFVPRMLKDGKPGRIVNTASIGGFLPSPLMSPYSASKFAVVALSESLWGELRMLQSTIGVHLLAPGPVQSGIFNDPFGDAGNNPATQQFVQLMRDTLTQNGMTPDEMARRAFAGIDAGSYWLFPHPEHLFPALEKRVAAILNEQDPPSFP